ncbi:DUF4363 family protein [Marinisporobacter balticus]|uniref:Uncharacterized protein DUF4363 n=1 Tax=Marinisporobacter balticus TaxID=2018667 RepID=A0A4R2KPK0_9FIRM|nr:DUF4363 family protein [Marinisporobacter balticus]TCO68525.1 uncharacterized protein DUF4363 [Marinisporobacter balticus]
MKILIITLLSIVIVIGAWFFLYENIENTCSKFINDLTHIGQNIQTLDWDSAYSELLKVNDHWQQTRKTWAALLPHHEIDNIDLTMAKASQYVKSKNVSLSLGEIETLKKLFNIVKENEALTLTNVL